MAQPGVLGYGQIVSGGPLQGLGMVFERQVVSYYMIKDTFQTAPVDLLRIQGLE